MTKKIEKYCETKKDVVDFLGIVSTSFPFTLIANLGKKTTNPMRAYYFGVILPYIKDWNKIQDTPLFYKAGSKEIAEENIDNIDYMLRLAFYYELIYTNKETVRKPKTLSFKGDREEVLKYIDTVKNHFATLGLYIPEPKER